MSAVMDPVARPWRFALRLSPCLYAELDACAFETGISVNEPVTCAVEKLMHEARVDQEALVERVGVKRVGRPKTGHFWGGCAPKL